MEVLKAYMATARLKECSQRTLLANGVVITCVKSYTREDIYIAVPPVTVGTAEITSEEISGTGFLAHPRNGTVKGHKFPTHDSARGGVYGIAHVGKGYKRVADQAPGSTKVIDMSAKLPAWLVKDTNGATIKDWGIDEWGAKHAVAAHNGTKPTPPVSWGTEKVEFKEGDDAGPPYPLVAGDYMTYHFTKTDDTWTAEGPQELMYGNVDWKGPVTDDPADRKILTYKGNPSRYWPIGQFVEIPGLSSVDHSVDGDLNSYEYMTVFGDKIYEGGKVLVTMPWLYHPLNSSSGGWDANHQNAHVLGAAYRESDGRLFCVIKTCYNSYPTVKPAPTGETPDPGMVSVWRTYKNGVVSTDWLADKAGAEKQVADSKGALTLVEVPDPGRGYFVELIMRKAGDIPGGWTRMLRIPTDNAWANCNFFFSEDGTKAVSVQLGSVWEITITGESATFTKTDVGKFQTKIEADINNTSESVRWSDDGVEIIAKSKDFRNHSKSVRAYKSTKSGSIVIAADYKKNELTTMTATISGGDTHNKIIERSAYWGETAVMGELHTGTFDRILKEPTPHHWFSCGESQRGCAQAAIAGSSCAAVCTVSATNMTFAYMGDDDEYDGTSNASTGCRQVWKINEDCVQTGKAEACITTTTTAKNGVATRTDCIIMSGFGTWTQSAVVDSGYYVWYWDEEPNGSTKIRHYESGFLPGYYCANHPSGPPTWMRDPVTDAHGNVWTHKWDNYDECPTINGQFVFVHEFLTPVIYVCN